MLKTLSKAISSRTIRGNDGDIHGNRSTDDNGRSTIIKLNQQNIEVNNGWVVLFSLLLYKTFQAYINVEVYHSVKSIKYICKYVNKDSDMKSLK